MRHRGRLKTVSQAFAITATVLLCSIVARAERLPIKIYTTGDGLAHNEVTRIVRDSRGFLWFCTFEGLSRFDGYSFTTYGVDDGLPSPVVRDLLETREGEYWVATAGGLCRFNPKGVPRFRVEAGPGKTSPANLMFTVYSPGADAASRTVTKLMEDSSGIIWCGTASGLYQIKQDEQVTFQLAHIGMATEREDHIGITSILEDRRGTLWIGSGRGIYRLFADRSVECYRKPNGLLDDNVTSLLEDREGRIWVGTPNGGLCRLVPDPGKASTVVDRSYTEKDGLPTRWISRLFQTSDGNLWAASNKGLIQFIPTPDGRDFRFRVYAQPEGLTYPEVLPLAEDRAGNLWVGITNNGVAKIARSGITSFDGAEGFSYANSIFLNRAGDLVVAGGPVDDRHYVNRFDGERFTRVKLPLPRGATRSWGWNQLVLEDRAGEWWVATHEGLYRFPKAITFKQLARTPPKAVYTTRDGLAGNVILRLFEDSRGDMWISAVGVGGWLTRWERATETFHHYSAKDGLPFFADSYIISFCEDRTGAVWIGFSFTSGSRLVRYRDGRFALFTSTDDGLPEGGIFNLFVDSSGRLWIPTTRGGLSHTDNPEAEHPTFDKYTTANGLASNSIKSLTEDRRGRIYIGTGRGIDRLDLEKGHIRHYTTADGLVVGDSSGALADSTGALWFSFATGLIRLIPEPESPPIPPPILITGLSVAGGARAISALGESEVAPLDLGAGENQLRIDFVALGFSPGEGLRYQYQLKGANEEWSPLSDQRTVNFANLAPGRYRFLVRAVNADGAASENPAGFSFTIRPPIWQRWWVVTLAALAVALATYALYRYRVARLLELERVRTRIASDLHDDIGANLTRIAILSEVAHAQLHDDEASIEMPLSSIAEISRESVASMGDIVWAINPKRDHLIDLVQRMRRLASEVFAGRKIEFEFRAPETEDELKLGADVRRDVFLIFKEAVNNAARHSGCSSVDIELRVDRYAIVLVVRDDGRGFDTEGSTEGNGLVSMKRRAASLAGELQLSSIEGKGTEVSLKVPFR
jgi:ligand-binding sensor domain-containing protein/signal transduction histidine kinase